MSVSYRIGTVSRLTGVAADTLRAWERRYGAVTPGRGDRGRDYGQAEIDRLILLRRVTERGHSIGSVARLSDEELRGLLLDRGDSTTASFPLIQPLLAALENFDAAELTSQMGRIAVVLPPSETVHQVVLPVMKECGERWHEGSLSIAQLCLMAGLVHNLLGTLMGLYRPIPGAPKLIFAAPAGESHTLGALAAAMLAAGAGLSPIYLGSDVPAKEIVHAARRSGAKVVVMQMGGTATKGLGALEELREIEKGLPSGVELWLGGVVDFEPESAVVVEDFPALEQRYRALLASV